MKEETCSKVCVETIGGIKKKLDDQVHEGIP